MLEGAGRGWQASGCPQPGAEEGEVTSGTAPTWGPVSPLSLEIRQHHCLSPLALRKEGLYIYIFCTLMVWEGNHGPVSPHCEGHGWEQVWKQKRAGILGCSCTHQNQCWPLTPAFQSRSRLGCVIWPRLLSRLSWPVLVPPLPLCLETQPNSWIRPAPEPHHLPVTGELCVLCLGSII